MKRTLFWSSISLITFALGVATVFVWIYRNNLNNKSSEAVSLSAQRTDVVADKPILSYCELANNPEKYDGKVVRVNAQLWFQFHGYYFQDKNCESEEKQAAVVFTDDKRGLEILNKIAKETGLSEYHPWGFPQIIAVGKFSRVKPSRKSDRMEDNVYLRFEIWEVEKASTP